MISQLSQPTARRRRAVWRPMAAAAVGVAGLVGSGFGVFASLSATATNVAPESVSSGTLRLTLADNGAGFSQAVANVAPGDTVNRFVTLTNSGTLEAQGLTMQIAATGGAALISDGVAPSTTKALRVSVSSCSVAWTPTTGACGGTTTQLLAPTVLSSVSAPVALSTAPVAANAVHNLQISLVLPDQNETTVNGALPANTIQGLNASLTYTFAENQRTATTTRS